MANIELLNNNKHKNIRILSVAFPSVQSNIHRAMIMPEEFSLVQREYPIVFCKDPETGQFYSTAILGFSAEENLFVSAGQWVSQYIPLTLRKGPFLIGFQEQEHNGVRNNVPVIYIDLDHPTISQSEGELIFEETGERSLYMDEISHTLMSIHEGAQRSKAMIAAFTDLSLIEPVSLNVEFNNGEKINLGGIYTINEQTLIALTGDNLESLNKNGFLKNAFCVVNSLENFKKMIDIKNNLLKPLKSELNAV